MDVKESRFLDMHPFTVKSIPRASTGLKDPKYVFIVKNGYINQKIQGKYHM